MALCTDEQAFKKECNRLGIVKELIPMWIGRGANATTHHFSNDKEGEFFTVCVRVDKQRTKAQTYSLLAHEAVHILEGWFEIIGEKHPGEEIRAYGIQNITQSLIEAYDICH